MSNASKRDIELATRDRERLERSGHVRVQRPTPLLRAAFKELGAALLEALTYKTYSPGRGVYVLTEYWAMPEDFAAAQTLAKIAEEENRAIVGDAFVPNSTHKPTF